MNWNWLKKIAINWFWKRLMECKLHVQWEKEGELVSQIDIEHENFVIEIYYDHDGKVLDGQLHFRHKGDVYVQGKGLVHIEG